MTRSERGDFDVRVDREKDLTVVSVTGPFTGDSACKAIERFYGGEPTAGVLWDLTAARFDNITPDAVRQIARLTRRYADRRKRGKTALVFSADVGFGFGRMFGTLQELEDSPVSNRSFRSMTDAVAWLESEEEK